MRKRKSKTTQKVSSKVVEAALRVNTAGNSSEKDFNSQNSSESGETYQDLLEIAERMLKTHQESLGMWRCSALKHVAWNSNDFEKDLAEIKLCLSKIEKDKKRIEMSSNLVNFMRALDHPLSHKNNP